MLGRALVRIDQDARRPHLTAPHEAPRTYDAGTTDDRCATPCRLPARRAVKRRIVTSIVGVATVAVLVLGIPLAIACAHLYRDQEVLRLERTASETRRTVDVSAV